MPRRIDLPGLLISSAATGLLVYTIIEAPDRGSVPCPLSRDSRRGPARDGVRGRGAAHRSADARCHPVQSASLLRRQRRGDHRLLRAVRLHLPHHAVLPVHPRLRHPVHWRADPPRRALSIAAGVSRQSAPGRPRSAPASSSPRPAPVRPGVRVDRGLAGYRALPADGRPDGDHGHRARADQHPGYRVHPVRTTRRPGRNWLSRQRRHPRGRRCPGRCRHRQRLQQRVPAQAGYHAHARASRVRLRRGTRFGSGGTGHRAPRPGLDSP